MLNQTISPAASDVQVIRQADNARKTIQVGAYCRVSTDLEIQKSSLELQMSSYQRIIDNHPGWVLASIYADKGLSGTSVNHRKEFIRMIDDAKAGKLDYILVKSISRFSRNTVDLLKYVRELNEIGVHVYFEKEHLDTGHSSEFLLTLFGAHAQEEIISLSENMKVGRRMRFAKGEQQWTNLYGYAKGWKIVPKEAEVIRRIFFKYLDGAGLSIITRELNNDGIPTPTGKGSWADHTVSMLMRNEKYAGHMLMQKSYIQDPITHKRVVNRNAIVPQYFKENHHTAIVPPEQWDAAKIILTMKDRSRGTTQYPYYGILRCPFCGSPMVRFHYVKKDYFWTCGGEKKKELVRKKRSSCPPYSVHEASLNKAMQTAGMPLEYWPLIHVVESISFPRYDWNHLTISLKGKTEPVTVPITYDLISNFPLPVTTEASEDWGPIGRPDMRRIIYINGTPLDPCRSGLILKRIESLRKKVIGLAIYPPESYEADIPRVEPRIVAEKADDVVNSRSETA